MPTNTRDAVISFDYTEEIGIKLGSFMDEEALKVNSGTWTGNSHPGVNVKLSDTLVMTNLRYIVNVHFSELDATDDGIPPRVTVTYRQYIV